ncbi:MAG TPA: restriction endonuclease subunit S [Desulfuromonadales bacterium]|nr:restriction endonuclease subunit S [Desulfuromonadales bacterium]
MSFPRYECYKESGVEWLGEVPVGWEVKPVKAFSTCNDDVLEDSTPADYEIEYVEISGVNADRGIMETTTIPFGAAPSRARRRVKDGDVIVSTVRTYLRAIAPVIQPAVNMIVSTGFAVVRPRSVQSSFLGYLFRSEFMISGVIARSVGVSYPAINASELIRLKVPFPHLPEQHTIAAFLDRETGKIDELVAEQERLIALLKEKRQATISNAVTKGLNPDAPMKDSGIEWLGAVPVGWDLPKLKHFTQFGGGGTPSRENLDYWNGNIPWISPKDMKVECIESSEESITESGLANSSSTLVPPGRVLMVVRSGILKHTIPVAINDVPVALNQDMKALDFTNISCLSRFFMRWVQGLNDQLLLAWSKQGATVESIEQSYLAETVMPLPPLAEQTAITAFIDSETDKIDALVGEARLAIGLLKERRSALISAAVTGKIKVPDSDRSDLSDLSEGFCQTDFS